MDRELVESIENLGDLLGLVSELSKSILNKIKSSKQEPMHDTYIYKLKTHICSAEYYYTKFHTNIWE